MSLLDWFAPRKKDAEQLSRPALESAGLTRMESTRPAGGHGGRASRESQEGRPAPSSRKTERMARRELLYGVVREAMVRAGVLSASYKFKVLSLDARGRQFLVMVDLAPDHLGNPGRMGEIEAMIAQGAKSRHDIVVSAVYWRLIDHVAVGAADLNRAARGADSHPMPLAPRAALQDSQPGELVSPPGALEAPAARPAVKPGTRYEPVLSDEVEAFKRALASGATASQALSAAKPPDGAAAKTFHGAPVHGPQSYTLLTGFEDTELPDEEMRRDLNGTQRGDPR